MPITEYTDEHVAELLRALPPAPTGWVTAAAELPRARAELDTIVALATADAEFRRALIEDLETALRAAGFTADRRRVVELRRRLEL
jgi:hypothetical protein